MGATCRYAIASTLRKGASNANIELSCKPPVPSYEQVVGALWAQASEPAYERSRHRRWVPNADATGARGPNKRLSTSFYET